MFSSLLKCFTNDLLVLQHLHVRLLIKPHLINQTAKLKKKSREKKEQGYVYILNKKKNQVVVVRCFWGAVPGRLGRRRWSTTWRALRRITPRRTDRSTHARATPERENAAKTPRETNQQPPTPPSRINDTH